jgi:uncharacterized protein (DUF2147 family)
MRKLKSVLLALPLFFLIFLSDASEPVQNNPGDKIIGNWQPSDGRSVIQIYKGSGQNGEDKNKYYGKIVWLLEPNDASGNPRTDINNPDEKKRNNPLKGLVNLRDLEFVGSSKELVWENGKIYDPKNGSDYSFEAKMDVKNENLLDGRGYIGISLIGRTDTWKRLVKK